MSTSRRDFLCCAAGAGLGMGLPCFSLAAAGDSVGAAAPSGVGLRIAVVQQESIPGAVGPNREKALAFAREALRIQPDLILFHEALLTGYVENIRELAEETTGPTTQAFQELLGGTETRVLYGLVEHDGTENYTAATLVTADGVIANYRKTHLWWKASGVRHEPSFFRPGNALVTFDLKGWKCGIMICYDGDFPEMARAYARLGCQVLFWLNNRNSRGKDEVMRLVRANSLIMATSCCCGRNDTRETYRGGSNIIHYDGTVLAEIWDDEGIISADIDPSGVLAARENNAGYRGLRPELYR